MIKCRNENEVWIFFVRFQHYLYIDASNYNSKKIEWPKRKWVIARREEALPKGSSCCAVAPPLLAIRNTHKRIKRAICSHDPTNTGTPHPHPNGQSRRDRELQYPRTPTLHARAPSWITTLRGHATPQATPYRSAQQKQ